MFAKTPDNYLHIHLYLILPGYRIQFTTKSLNCIFKHKIVSNISFTTFCLCFHFFFFLEICVKKTLQNITITGGQTKITPFRKNIFTLLFYDKKHIKNGNKH